MKTLRMGLTFLAILLPLTAVANEKPPPPASGVSTTETSQRKVVEAVLPGRLLDTNLPHLPLTLLVAADSPQGARTRTLLEFDPAGEGRLEVLATGLPEDIVRIHTLADGKILLGKPGVIYQFDALKGTLEPLLTTRHLDLGAAARFSTGTDLLVPRVGRLEIWDLFGADKPARRRSLDLPVKVDRQRGGLRLFTPRLNPLLGGETSRAVLGPEPHGNQRLHSTLLDLSSEASRLESWSLLPTPETVEDRWYILIDDQPALVVTTTSAEKFGIFEKKKLRVFTLRDDRTRRGRTPSLAIDTTTRRWYSPGIEVLDWDDDGRDDLAVITPDGLGAKKLVLSIHPGKGNGGFISRARKTVLVAPQASWHFGADLDGDRRPDLVTSDKNGLRIFPGVAAKHKKLVVEKAPRAAWALQRLAASAGVRDIMPGENEKENDVRAGRPRVVDTDGDGQGEVLVWARLAGRTVLWWVALRPPGP